MRIYLSKSNQHNPNHTAIVRQHCIDNNIEVLEHEGNEYNKDLPLDADKFIIVGHPESMLENNQYAVGWGQSGELFHFAKNGKGKENIFIASEGINVFALQGAAERDKDDRDTKKHYTTINLGDPTTLKDALS